VNGYSRNGSASDGSTRTHSRNGSNDSSFTTSTRDNAATNSNRGEGETRPPNIRRDSERTFSGRIAYLQRSADQADMARDGGIGRAAAS
jgi:hypothetical protein